MPRRATINRTTRLVKEFDQALPAVTIAPKHRPHYQLREDEAGVPVAVTGSAASGPAIGERDRVPRD
jgi:hypothetical protein